MLSSHRKSLSTSSRRRLGRAQLGFEALEQRMVPAGIFLNPVTGDVTILGSSQDDVAKVAIVNDQVKVSLDCYSDAPPYLTDDHAPVDALLAPVARAAGE